MLVDKIANVDDFRIGKKIYTASIKVTFDFICPTTGEIESVESGKFRYDSEANNYIQSVLDIISVMNTEISGVSKTVAWECW